MKKSSIFLLILLFLTFLGYQTLKTKSYSVLEIISPTKIAVDLNSNGMEDENELVSIDVQSFSTKPNPAQEKLSKKLQITDEDALGLGFLAENFAKTTLSEKQIKLKQTDQNPKHVLILVDNKNYETLLLNSGLAFSGDEKKNNLTEFKKNLEKVRKLNLRIFNNKSHKYHKLNCKYGLMAHNVLIIPQSQLPKDAKACKFCFGKHKKYHKYKHKKYKDYYFTEDTIPDIKQPPMTLSLDSVKIFLTDMTRVLKPTNSCKTEVCKTTVNQVNNATSTIDFAIYGYTKIPALQQALLNAEKRGVKVRFVYDVDNKSQNLYPDTFYLANIIKDNSADFAPANRKSKSQYQSAIMHNKFFIFDNKTVITGSANISNTDMSGFNSNAVILINSPQVASAYSKEFEQMYEGRFHKSKSKIKNKENITLGDAELSIYFAPKDKPITNQIIPLVDGAKKYIYMPVFLITQKELVKSLIDAKKRGVDVRIIVDATNASEKSSRHNWLRKNGIPVKTENFAGKLHSKSMIIDDTYTVIGSMNFSKSGESVNDENLIIIKNKQIAVFYKNFFKYLWNRIPTKWLNKNARSESVDSIGSCHDGIDNDFDGKIDSKDDSCKPKLKKRKSKKNS